MTDLTRELEIVLAAVEEAGELLVQEAKTGPRGRGGSCPVDAEIGALLVEQIGSAFPHDTIICEEGGSQRGSSGRAFVIDPHDGTYCFVEQGRRETSISIGLVEEGRLLLGVVSAPCWFLLADDDPLRDLWDQNQLTVSWAKGEVVYVNSKPVHPQTDDTLRPGDRVLVSARIRGPKLTKNQRALAPAKVVPCASIATRFALVAAGLAASALTWNNPLAPWDLLGGQAVLLGSGGDVVDDHGRRIAWRGTSVASHKGYFGARSVRLATGVAHRFSSAFR